MGISTRGLHQTIIQYLSDAYFHIFIIIIMIEEHTKFRDKYQELNAKADEIAADLSTVTTEYELAEKYTDIDQEIYELYLWYDEKKKMFEQYLRERQEQEEKIVRLTRKMKALNTDVQNARLRAIYRPVS